MKTTFIHALRIGQTVYLAESKRVRCKHCGGHDKWKYYVKAIKITGMGYFAESNKSEVSYYYRRGDDKCFPFGNDTIFIKRSDAEQEVELLTRKDATNE